ncbi:MAG: hypothetical protein NWF05_02620 [Candidatus Bathyarchaeota archaeon]|nr:hypothetical protein [Candidatus Bathyarchaeota archaeon]
MKSKPCGSILLFLITVSLFLSFNSTMVSAQNSGTSLCSKLQEANTAVTTAFEVVLAAEKAGADVTSLLNQLNDATEILGQAETAYEAGNLTYAQNLGGQVVLIANQVLNSAYEVEQAASISFRNTLYVVVAATTICFAVFVTVLFVFWRRFKKNYTRNLADAKPEVPVYES